MRYLILGLKGMAYGITHIVPGLGGALVLLMLGIYEQFVDAVGNFFIERRKWKEHLSFLVPLGVGMVIGMIVLATLIRVVSDRYPVAMMLFFMGLVLGTIPSVLKMHSDMRFTPGRMIALVCGLLVIVGLKVIESHGTRDESLESLSTSGGILYNALVSFIAGGASVTPGLDGSYVLLLGNTFDPVMEALSKLREFHVEWGVLASTGIAAVLGILVFSKLIDAVIKRFPAHAYYCVLGLVAASVYGLWPDQPAQVGPVVLALSFVAGLALALFFAQSTGANKATQDENAVAR